MLNSIPLLLPKAIWACPIRRIVSASSYAYISKKSVVVILLARFWPGFFAMVSDFAGFMWTSLYYRVYCLLTFLSVVLHIDIYHVMDNHGIGLSLLSLPSDYMISLLLVFK